MFACTVGHLVSRCFPAVGFLAAGVCDSEKLKGKAIIFEFTLLGKQNVFLDSYNRDKHVFSETTRGWVELILYAVLVVVRCACTPGTLFLFVFMYIFIGCKL